MTTGLPGASLFVLIASVCFAQARSVLRAPGTARCDAVCSDPVHFASFLPNHPISYACAASTAAGQLVGYQLRGGAPTCVVTDAGQVVAATDYSCICKDVGETEGLNLPSESGTCADSCTENVGGQGGTPVAVSHGFACLATAEQGLSNHFGTQGRELLLSTKNTSTLWKRNANNGLEPTTQLPQILVIAGDVSVGSRVECEGDICILGRLSGSVHAGSQGDSRAVVRALRIDTSNVEIAGIKSDRRFELESAALIARTPDGRLELWPMGESAASEGESRVLTLVKSSSPTVCAAAFTGVYISAVGFALLLAPLSTFTLLFDQRSVAPVWMRIGGALCCLFGIYYLGAAHGEVTGAGVRSFYRSTVAGRLILGAVFVCLVALGKAQRQLLVLAAVNWLGAAGMQRALAHS